MVWWSPGLSRPKNGTGGVCGGDFDAVSGLQGGSGGAQWGYTGGGEEQADGFDAG